MSVEEARDAARRRPAGPLQGWIRTRRDSKGGFSFLELNDGSCLGNIQIVADAKLAELRERSQASRGRLQRHGRGRGQSLAAAKGRRPKSRRPKSIVHGWADPEAYPLQKKRHSFEFLRESAICGRGPTRSARSPACATASARSIHDFFQEQGFLYVHTPIITASDCEGAGEMFQVTTLDLAKAAANADGDVDYAQDFFATARLSHRQRPARRRDLRLRARQGLHVRPDVSRRELEHVAAPGRVLDGRAGDGVLRADRQHGAGRGVPEADLSATCWPTAPRTWQFFAERDRQGGRSARLEGHRCAATFVRLPYTEAVEILTEVGQDVRVSRSRGAAICRPSTSAI